MSNFSENLRKILNGENISTSGNLKRPQLKTLSKIIGVAALGMFVIYLSTVFTKPATIDLGPTPTIPAMGKNVIDTKEKNISENQIDRDEQALEAKLEEALGQVDGVGEISVTVNLASTIELKYAINKTTGKKTTQEKDQNGGSRTISELNENGQIVLRREASSDNEKPVVVKEIKPAVKGVLVVAEGAKSLVIRRELTRAVQILLGIDANKVTVMPKGGK